METKKYYGGALFINRNKANKKAPDLSGDVEIDMDTLKYLVELAKKNAPLKMRMAAWVTEGKSGKFYSVKLSEDKKPAAQANKAAFLGDDDAPF
jgi:hypothetical protein